VLDRVAEQVEPFEAGVDAQFDPPHDSDAIALDDGGVEVGVDPVVVRDGDAVEPRVGGGRGEFGGRHRAVGDGRVRVEVGDDPVRIHGLARRAPY
jgi:hypothetical protein